MAFVVKETKRYTHPDEPDFWVEMRLPPSTGEMRGIDPSRGEIEAGLVVLSRVISAWSDERPVTREAVDELDIDTFKWLFGILNEAKGGRSEQEKKGSSSRSSPTSSTRGASRQNSDT